MAEAPVLQVWRLLDGKPGHENQSLGLVRELSRLTPSVVHDLGMNSPLPEVRPDLIVGAGHRTHWRLLRLGRKFGAFTVVLMKPSLPLSCFDLCLFPRHDLKTRKIPSKVLITEGVLNTIEASARREDGQKSGLILLGGPSKEFAWDNDTLRSNLEELTRASGLSWRLTDSRRTPQGFLESLRLPACECISHSETSVGWVGRELATAEEVWVTEDSVSMVYEALSSGAKVGLLPLALKGAKGRVARGVDHLLESGRLLSWQAWLRGERWKEDLPPLTEARRCAEYLWECLQRRLDR